LELAFVNCLGGCWRKYTIAAAELMGTSVGTPLSISRFCARRE